jgi:outer membrane lipopolysaccharide assembly protein LptE/RlpB
MVLRMLCVSAVLLFLAGCSYQFFGSSGNRLTSGQSLWVSFIAVEIDSPSAQTVLRRSLLEECHALRGLYPSDTQANADLRISGKLRSYVKRQISYTAHDEVNLYRLSIEVDLEMYQKGTATPMWKGTLKSYQDYPASRDLALERSAEAAALASASRILAQQLIMAVEQSY